MKLHRKSYAYECKTGHALREGDKRKAIARHVGKTRREQWPAHAWPGGYPILYYAHDGEPMCANCLNSETAIHFDGQADGWKIDAADIYYEGPPVLCAHCAAQLVSAYGDPNEPDA